MYRPPKGPRAILILTFPTADPPPRVTAGYLSFPTRLVIPKPRRCEKCQVYGHNSQRCRSTEVTCGKCSGTGHYARECQNETKCPACDGDHESSSRRCPAWHFHQRINELVFGEKRDPGEARRIAKAEFGIMVQSTTPHRRLAEDPPSPGDRDQFPSLESDERPSTRESTPNRQTMTDTVKKRPAPHHHRDRNNNTGAKPKRPNKSADREATPSKSRGCRGAHSQSSTRRGALSSDEDDLQGPWTQSGTKSRSKRPRVSPNRDTSPLRPRGRHGVVNLPDIERSASEPCEARGRPAHRTGGNTNACPRGLTPTRRSTRGATLQQTQSK